MITEILPVALFVAYLFLMGGLEDGYNGRNARTNWLFSHVLNWGIRDWIGFAFFTRYTINVLIISKITSEIFLYIGFLIFSIILYTLIHKIAIRIGAQLLTVIPPNDNRPHWLVWRSVQIIPGIIIGLFLP